MCLSGTVGPSGNNRLDVKTIQILLNMNLRFLIPLSPLSEDGAIGKNTREAIRIFQERAMNMREPTMSVDPNSPTLNKLREGIPDLSLSVDALRQIKTTWWL